MNAAILRASLMPGLASTPELTSTAHGPTRRIASPTFSAVRPPDNITGNGNPLRYQVPVERGAGAAVSAFDVGIEQQTARGAVKLRVL